MSFWQSEKDGDNFSYRVVQRACVGPNESYQFYMGGVAMATHVDALERYFGKPLLWVTTQFLSHGMLDNELTLEVTQIGGGENVVQAEAVMRRDDEVLHRSIAALGARGDEPDRAFVTMPDVKKPTDCAHKPEDANASADNLIGQFDRRTAFEDSESGTEYMWIRPLEGMKTDAAYLTLVSDFFLGAHERTRRGTSLDNTFRLINAHQTDWILTVTQVSSFTRGAAHGHIHMFAEDGTLLATSSQTGMLPRLAQTNMNLQGTT